ncbi:adenylate/guanylate cyclase domain-containing protein [Flammeovirga sp. EKP202]|uniref:adenylate/guanylate cyclase domain-containing protein n=1 Tax=Flammeovirga sp. EKP202 TaxID=2770592 RepID=UPI00165FF5BE|nr:adenylate/guanylate cyclase domain-containing protein [Flammeovirga sp. EKP202]MBD0402961.1 adenylate/guanylate cyclase domain-containing protein [Flammeovirga sp. EKP202]
MISIKKRRQLVQVIPFTVISLLFGLIYTFLEHGILGDTATYPTTGNPYNFNPVSSAFLTLTGGTLMGLLEVFCLNKLFHYKSFSKKLIIKTLIYILIIAVLVFIMTDLGHAIEMEESPFNPKVIGYAMNFLMSFAFISMEVYMALGIVICLFYTEVSDNIGQEVLINFFLGKYHSPTEEHRVFMFLDMKDSTAIAERLGHTKYFDMLREYYADLSNSILNYSGHIYQYVGDEVVVTWTMENGLEKNNCLNCFYDMKKSLEEQAEKYQERFGVAPTFKAGIHLGKVTTGEIGVTKKDIIFSGDVLNTTARIQSLCNSYKTDLLISERLLEFLKVENYFTTTDIGTVELRGRNEKVNLFSVKQIA